PDRHHLFQDHWIAADPDHRPAVARRRDAAEGQRHQQRGGGVQGTAAEPIRQVPGGDPERQQHAELSQGTTQRGVQSLMTQSSMAYRANQAYRGAAVAVPPLRAMVMLYDGAITFLQKSVEAQEARRFEES